MVDAGLLGRKTRPRLLRLLALSEPWRVVDLSHPLDDGTRPTRVTQRCGCARRGRSSATATGSRTCTSARTAARTSTPRPTSSRTGRPSTSCRCTCCVGPAVVVDLRDLGPREPVEWERLAARRAAGPHARPAHRLGPALGVGGVRGPPVPQRRGGAWELVDASACGWSASTRSASTRPAARALPAHEALLHAGGVVVENLTNLAAVDHPEPVLSVLPLPLRGVDGSPVRAVALLPA